MVILFVLMCACRTLNRCMHGTTDLHLVSPTKHHKSQSSQRCAEMTSKKNNTFSEVEVKAMLIKICII